MSSALVLNCLGAQNNPALTAPKIRASASLVLVPVSPLDKSGHFISGLNAKDFQILVEGKPVELSGFDVVTEGAPTSPPTSPAEPPLPPNVFRNIPGTSASQSNLVILLVDYLNTRMVDRMGLRDALLKFFSNKLQPDQEIAVYGLTRSLVLLQPFTRDPVPLIAVSKDILKQKGQPPDPVVGRPLYQPGVEGPPTGRNSGSSGMPPGTDTLADYFTLLNARREYNLDQFHRAHETLAAFRELAQSFGGIAGKKTVMWLTGDASPLNPSMMYRILIEDKSLETNGVSSWETAKTYEALNAAAISVFPVDVRGIGNSALVNAGDTLTHEEFNHSIGGTQWYDKSPYSGLSDMREGEAANAVLAMDSVAGETGATVLAGSNRVENLLDRAHKLWANYYVLSFTPEKSANEKAAAYHKIQVKLDRPGAHVLARRGFLTRPDAVLSSESEIQRDIAEAVTSPIDLTSLSLQLTLGEARDEGGTRHLPLTLTISNAVLGTLTEKGASYDLSIAVLVRDQHDRLLTNEGKRVRALVPSADVSGVAVKGLKYDSEFQAPAGNFFFGRVIVRDNLSGRTGTISLTLPSNAAGS